MEEYTLTQARQLLEEDEGQQEEPESPAASGEEASSEKSPSKHPSEQPSDPSSEQAGEQPLSDSGVTLGVDIVDIERMQKALERHSEFSTQVFSADERAYCESTANPAAHYALRFAAKEATVKALGTGFAEGIWVHDIEVKRNEKGRPELGLSGKALEIAQSLGVCDMSISLSYTPKVAVSCVLLITKDGKQKADALKDPMKELEENFKALRKELDEL